MSQLPVSGASYPLPNNDDGETEHRTASFYLFPLSSWDELVASNVQLDGICDEFFFDPDEALIPLGEWQGDLAAGPNRAILSSGLASCAETSAAELGNWEEIFQTSTRTEAFPSTNGLEAMFPHTSYEDSSRFIDKPLIVGARPSQYPYKPQTVEIFSHITAPIQSKSVTTSSEIVFEQNPSLPEDRMDTFKPHP